MQMKSFFCYPVLFYFNGMSILVIKVGFNEMLFVDAVVTSSESVHYSNCKESVNNNNDNDDG